MYRVPQLRLNQIWLHVILQLQLQIEKSDAPECQDSRIIFGFSEMSNNIDNFINDVGLGNVTFIANVFMMTFFTALGVETVRNFVGEKRNIFSTFYNWINSISLKNLHLFRSFDWNTLAREKKLEKQQFLSIKIIYIFFIWVEL